ncbi:MAG: BF3164 family lipoprotein [Gemmatimonadota bacterium]
MRARTRLGSGIALAWALTGPAASTGCGRRADQGAERLQAGAVRELRRTGDRRELPPALGTHDEEGPLEPTRFLGDSATFGYVKAIQPVDSLLVVADVRLDPYLVLVDLASGRAVRRFGASGDGPGELRAPSSLGLSEGPEPYLRVFDTGQQRVSWLDLRAPGASPRLVRELPLHVGPPVFGLVEADGGLVAAGGFGAEYTLLVLDSVGRVLARERADPPFDSEALRRVWGDRMLNQADLAAAPSGTRLALAYTEVNRIDLFRSASGPYISVAGPRPTEPHYEIGEDGFRFLFDRHERAYFGVAATDSFVYALFCGCVQGTPGGPDLSAWTWPRRIHVFDWDGNFVGELTLDRGVTAIGVSAADSTLWGAFTDPVPGIAEWSLSKWWSER